MTRKVIITRPRAQAEPLAQRLRAAGHDAVELPLLDIGPVADDAPLRAALAALPSYALVAFVSPNAIDAAFALLAGGVGAATAAASGAGGVTAPPLAPGVKWPVHVAIAVVGEGSRAALERHGLGPSVRVHCPPADGPSDSEHLLATLDLPALRGQKVLLIRGQDGRELMADGFRAAGARVDVVAAYTRRIPMLTPELSAQLCDLLVETNTWIITSSEALRGLVALVQQCPQPDLVSKLQQQQFLVPHARIEQTARALSLPRVTLTASGDEGVFAALQSRV